MLELDVYSEGYDHKPKTEKWLLNPAHITAVQFASKVLYTDGKQMYPPRAFVYLQGHIAGHESGSSSSKGIEVRDEASLAKLRGLLAP